MVIWYISKYATPLKYYFGSRHFHLSEEWVKSGHDVYVFTSNANHLTNALPVFKGRSFNEIIEGVNTVWLNTLKSKESSTIWRILSWFHFEWQLFRVSKKGMPKPDVVIVSSLSLLTVVNGYRFARKAGAKFIFEVRDIWPLSGIILGGISKYNPFMLLLAAIEKYGYKKANAIVGTIPNLKDHVVNVIGPTDKVYCIPQGIKLAAQESNEQLDQQFIDQYIPRNKFIVVYAGTINANNPLETLIGAARKLVSHTNIHFIVIGNGNKRDHYIQMSKDLTNITFPPAINKNKVAHLLSFASVCYDSFESELAKYGLSRNKWIDYMYAAKPIICSYSGYQSMINEANSGSFVPYGNSELLAAEILAYANMDPEELKAMGQRAKDFILKNRTFDKLAAAYEKLFVK